MGTPTTNLGLTKPTPGDVADRNVWGTTLNGNLDLLDAIFKSDGTGTGVGLHVTGNLALSGTISGTIHWGSSTKVSASADGNLLVTNNAGTDIGLLQLGGTTSAYPAIGRESAQIDFKLADASGWATTNAANYVVRGTGSFSTAGGSSLNLGTNGKALLQNSAATAGVDLDFSTDATLKLRNRGNTVDATVTFATQTPGDNSTNGATTAFVQTALGSYAPLASPALTGTPTAPTQTAGDSSTKLATTAFVQTAIAALPSVLLAKADITSAVSNYVLTGIGSNIKVVEILFDLLPATNATDLHMTVYDSGGAEITTNVYGFVHNQTYANGGNSTAGTNGTATSFIILTDNASQIGNGAAQGGTRGVIRILGMQTAGLKSVISSEGHWVVGANEAVNTQVVGNVNTTSVLTGFKLVFAAGNIASGTVRVIGYP